jgi:hypothetical protein
MASDGTPVAENPDSAGTVVRAYHASSTVQASGVPGQSRIRQDLACCSRTLQPNLPRT